MAPIIRTEKLRKVYAVGKERVVALNNVDLSIEKGEFCCIVGQSGSGKSTLLNQLAGLEKPTSGKVYIGKHEISKMTENELAEFRQQHLGFIFQSYNLLPTMTAAENVALPLMFKGVDKKTRLARARKELKAMGLLGRANHLPTEMSGGQQQRIAIARAIVNEPKLLLLDEPLGALDLKLRQDMQYELIRLKNELGITFIYVTHDQEEALTMSDTIVVMNQGYIQQMGTPEQIYNEPENAFVADFIGESNIVGGTMIHDELVEIFGAKFACVDKGFGNNKPVDVVIRPEDIDLVKPEDGTLQGVVTHLIFKGVHYEMEVTTPDGYEWLVHSTDMFPVGQKVGIHVDPFDIQIMNKPESEDEEAVGVNE